MKIPSPLRNPTRYQHHKIGPNINGASTRLVPYISAREPTSAVPQPSLSDLLSKIPEKTIEDQWRFGQSLSPQGRHARLALQRFFSHQPFTLADNDRVASVRADHVPPKTERRLGTRGCRFWSFRQPSSPVRVTRFTLLKCSSVTRSKLCVSFRDVVDPTKVQWQSV